MINWLVQFFLALGILFALMGNIGFLIFPDVYTRLQASSTCSTTSVFSILIAAMLSAGFSLISGKVIVIMLFFLISSPVTAHIIAQYAWRREIVPWRHYRKKARRS